MADLSALIERCEALTGPDWDVGCEVIAALIPTDAPDARKFYGGGRNPLASLDAAVAMVERVLPGWDWGTLSFGEDGAEGKVWMHGWHDNTVIRANHSYPVIALVLATLRALQAKGDGE